MASYTMLSFEEVLKKSTKLIFMVFVLFTLLSEWVEYYTNQLGGDLITLAIDYNMKESVTVFTSFFILSISCYSFSYLISKIKFNASLKADGLYCIHYLFFLVVMFYAISIFIFGVGVVSNENRNRIVELIYALLQPVFLLPLYFLFFYKIRNSVYWLALCIYIVSVLFAGFLNYFILISPILLTVFFRVNWFLRISLFVIGISILPIIRILKHVVGKELGSEVFFQMITFDNWVIFGRVVLDRFSYLANVKYMIQNSYVFEASYQIPSLNPFYANYLGSLFYKAIYAAENVERNINNYYNYLILGDWSSSTYAPLLAQLFIDPLGGIINLLAYLAICVVMNLALSMISASRGLKMFVTIIPLVLYCLPGFYWPYMNFIQAVFLFVAIILFIKLVKV